MSSLATTDLCDTNRHLILKGEVKVLEPIFKHYGRNIAFSGQVVTLKIFEDNVLIHKFLESKGHGRVLVIDGGGSKRCAVVGGNLAQDGCKNGWAGIIVNGCIRDIDQINSTDIGVRALASNPLRPNKLGHGEKNIPVCVAGTFIHPGEWIYADIDGVLVSNTELTI